jgi:hypothetical protein
VPSLLAGDRRRRVIGGVKLEVTDVSFIDQDGERRLERVWREGVELETSGCMNRHVIDRIRTQFRQLARRPPPRSR